MNDVPGYETLKLVLEQAFEQATAGKGAERHARGNPFEEQHMQTISSMLGSDRGMAFQAIKKLTEGLDFTEPDRRERELLGVIVYVAGIIVWHRKQSGTSPQVDVYKQFATAMQAYDSFESIRAVGKVPELAMPFGANCPDCGAAEGALHYVLCPRLPVPEAHAEAVEAAFAEEADKEQAKPTTPSDWHDGDMVECVLSLPDEALVKGQLFEVQGGYITDCFGDKRRPHRLQCHGIIRRHTAPDFSGYVTTHTLQPGETLASVYGYR